MAGESCMHAYYHGYTCRGMMGVMSYIHPSHVISPERPHTDRLTSHTDPHHGMDYDPTKPPHRSFTPRSMNDRMDMLPIPHHPTHTRTTSTPLHPDQYESRIREVTISNTPEQISHGLFTRLRTSISHPQNSVYTRYGIGKVFLMD